MLHRKQMQPNWSAHSDIQQQVAAARRMLRAGGLKRKAVSTRSPCITQSFAKK